MTRTRSFRDDTREGITVPAIVDIPIGKVVTNDIATLTLDLALEWRAHHRRDAPDVYPHARRNEMDMVMDRVYRDVNEGVYRCGFAKSQDAYEAAYRRLFAALDWLSERLADRRYLVGTPSRKPTCASSRPWSASTPCTTPTSSAIATS